MDTDPAVQAALEHAKWILARSLHSSEVRAVQGRDIVAGFYSELRHALQDLTAAVEAARGDRK